MSFPLIWLAVALIAPHRTASLDVTENRSSTILISYFSVSGWTKALAEEVAKGCINSSSATVLFRRTNETTCNDILSADGIIMGSPVYLGTMASEVKAVLEKIQLECVGYPSDALRNKVGGAFATGGHVRDAICYCGYLIPLIRFVYDLQTSTGKDNTRMGILLGFMSEKMVVTGSEDDTFGAEATHPNGATSVNFTPRELEDAHSLGR
jgi:NAD(P)H dehydrogenase (quinone)